MKLGIGNSCGSHKLSLFVLQRMIYVRNPYTGSNYYTVFRPVTLSPSRVSILIKQNTIKQQQNVTRKLG